MPFSLLRVLFLSCAFGAFTLRAGPSEWGFSLGPHLNLWSQNPSLGLYYWTRPSNWGPAALWMDLSYSRVKHHIHHGSEVHNFHFAPAVESILYQHEKHQLGLLLGGGLHLERGKILTSLIAGFKYSYYVSDHLSLGASTRFFGILSDADYWNFMLNLGFRFDTGPAEVCP